MLKSHWTTRSVGVRHETVSDSQGQFHIQNVPYGTYVLHIRQKVHPIVKQFRIRSNVPVDFSIRLTVAATGAEITVHPICCKQILRAQSGNR